MVNMASTADRVLKPCFKRTALVIRPTFAMAQSHTGDEDVDSADHASLSISLDWSYAEREARGWFHGRPHFGAHLALDTAFAQESAGESLAFDLYPHIGIGYNITRSPDQQPDIDGQQKR